jgi:diacylglycerol O-acyltransferase
VPTPAFAAALRVRRPRPPKALLDRLAEIGVTATRQAIALRDVSLGAIKKSLATLAGADLVGSVPVTAQHGPMNEPLRMARSLATLSLPIDGMQAVGRHFGATLNDVSAAIVDEGDSDAGTKASAMFVHLGAPGVPVVERIRQVAGALGAAKQELRSMSKSAAMTYGTAALGLAELVTATRVDRVTRAPANLVISNVPGRRERVYLDGAALVGMFPASIIAASVGLNVTLTSCHDHMDFGFIGNGTTMYDLPQLARHVRDAYEELDAAASKRRPAAATATRTRSAARQH